MNLIKDHTLTSSQCLPPLPQHCKNAKWRFVSDKSLLCKNTKSTECWCKKELTVATNVHVCVFFLRHASWSGVKWSIHQSLSLSTHLTLSTQQCVNRIHCHSLQSDTDRLLNMVEARLIPPCPWVNSINVTLHHPFHIYQDSFISPCSNGPPNVRAVMWRPSIPLKLHSILSLLLIRTLQY